MTKHTFAIAAAVLAAALSAQSDTPSLERWVYRPAQPFEVDPSSHLGDQVIVKFRDEVAVRLVDGRLTGIDAGLEAIESALAGATIRRLFSRDEADLDAERTRLSRQLEPGTPPLANLNRYFAVQTAGPRETERIVNELLASPVIETAYASFRAVPTGDIPPATPNFEVNQPHLASAPSGFGHRDVESVVGARGQGLYLAQLEGKHTLDHEDFPAGTPGFVLGTPASSAWNGWTEHGTACIGIMGGGRNAYGVRGMGSDCERFYTSSLENGASNMVSLATAALRAGDVMSSSYAWVVSGAHAPADWDQATYDAIRIAATAGIFYAYSAGNTQQDIGNTSLYGNRYAPGSLPSGGFIIGATGAGDSSRISFSNFGTQVVTNGWGTGVGTTGYGQMFDPGDVRQRYTPNFGGTSAAAPCVAGVLASLSGAMQHQLGRVPTLTEVRTALVNTGTAIPGGSIGNRPDLVALFQAFGVFDGLRVTQDALLGQNASLALDGEANAPFGIVASLGIGSTPIGANRPLLLDSANLFVIGSGALDANGDASFATLVPNDPALIDAQLFVQSVQARTGGLHLSNSVVWWLR
ncbi:MAG: S8 family serine peptidase [Planctomycetota bacterium]